MRPCKFFVKTWRMALRCLKEQREKDPRLDRKWIVSVVKDGDMDENAWQKAFAKTETPLGWDFAGELSFGREAFGFSKKA
jgi:hypothetical protein